MRIGILSARSAGYHPNRRLLEAGRRQGQDMRLVHPKGCLCDMGIEGAGSMPSPIGIRLDALLPRIGGTINPYARNLLRHFELSGIPLVNDSAAVGLACDKCRTLQRLSEKGIPIIDTFYVSNAGNLRKAVARLGGYPVVVKTPKGRQGAGVILVDSAATAQFAAHHASAAVHGLLVQRFVPPKGRTDLRVFVLGTGAAAAVKLTPKKGEFRTNFHLKAVGEPAALSDDISRLAVRSSRALGLEISGVDIILDAQGNPGVVEVNYAPGFRGFEALTGMDIASRIISYVADTYGATS
ncbi:MAG: RimK family alpha-L-glutamate ligase [Deltaproteobacteria bacterium]|nr:RimK family alpha-L-glutamate ligase [Deltaproteobacteria bacterium]MBW1817505.1 RimK family alpha-L-glutamate ligase [Deltaproteobacteria bacterium]